MGMEKEHKCMIDTRKKIIEYKECLERQLCFVNDCKNGIEKIIQEANKIEDGIIRTPFVSTAFTAFGNEIIINLDKIYDDKLNGIIAQNDFKRMYDGYVNQRIQIERQIQDFKNQKEEIEDRLDLDKIVKDFISMKNITSTIITMLVSKIEITQNKEVYIHYRFKELQKSAS